MDDRRPAYKSTSRIVEGNGNQAQGGNLHTLNNPSPVGGRGGTCCGDSGGPVFVNNTNEVIAVVSYGFSGTCHGADYSWRVDTDRQLRVPRRLHRRRRRPGGWLITLTAL